MRGWKLFVIFAVAIALWIASLAFGPTVVKEEGMTWDLGLEILLLFLTIWLVDLYAYKYTHHIDWKGFNSTLYQPQPVDVVELPRVADTKRSTEFGLYLLGGTRVGPIKGGGDKGVLFAAQDLIHIDKGDYVNVHVRSVPDLYRSNPLEREYEKPLSNLPRQMLEILETRGLAKSNIPVYVAWDPLKNDELEPVVKEKMHYKNLFNQVNDENATLRTMLKNYGSAATTVTKASRLQAETFRNEMRPRKRGIMREPEDEDDRRREE